ncbi:OmpA family protein [Pedobacter gandavensis]|uniref:OmpA family protein n=1 Tax=Pedobacter gandavensis TaxID=2679963 RepID=UPI0029319E40|nr:OmpA family protein [Pedobacter gandavensis]
MKLKILLVFMLLGSMASAQFVTNSKRVADVYYQNKEYYAAAEYYKKSLLISPDSAGFVVPYGFETKIKQESPKKDDYEYGVYRLAESLRQYKNFKDAERWYSIAIGFDNPRYNLANFWYGVCLRANQNYDEAIVAFKTFQQKNKGNDEYLERAKRELASCQFALYEVSHPRLYAVNRVQNNLNEGGSNYAPVWRGNTFIFTSSRPIGSEGKSVVLTDDKSNTRVTRKQSPYVNAIYEVSGSPLEDKIRVTQLPAAIKGKELAAAAFLPNGKTMYLTIWTAKDTRKIYQRSRNSSGNEDWSAPVELGGNVNISGFNAMQPFVSGNGKYLIFSSDRPGGFGKYDLWYCAIRSDGSLGQAVNMGNVVNTAGDEEAPYYNVKTKKLLFSSNGKIGLGGFDFYESEGDFDSWSEPRNLGFPFNSSKDDLYFTPVDAEDVEGYISSDRSSLCCLEIFHLKREFLNIRGRILDCHNGKPLENAIVSISDSLQEYKFTTGPDGKYNFKLNTNRQLKITAEKEKYLTKKLSYSYDQLAQKDTLFTEDICLDPIDLPIVLKDVLYEFDKAELTEDSKLKMEYVYNVMIDNPTIEIELGAHTDSKGTVEYNLDLSNRRAQSCVDFLISRGIPASRMTSKGYGMSMPIAPNKLPNGKDNPEGRALNRRTEFKVMKK